MTARAASRTGASVSFRIGQTVEAIRIAVDRLVKRPTRGRINGL